MAPLISRRTFVRGLGVGLALGPTLAAIELSRPQSAYAKVTIRTRAHEDLNSVDGETTYPLAFAASHLAVHWAGEPDASVTVSLSSDGVTYGAPQSVRRDEVGEHRDNGETYGAVILARGATWVRVSSDRKLQQLAVLGMVDGHRTVTYVAAESRANAAAAQPYVISRAGWGCDETLMTWAPEFHPTQKLICHHTAGQNHDPDPAATIRAIYYYHAVTQAWGDIGYNALVDESGRIYEGRYSRPYGLGMTPSFDSPDGRGVTAAHAFQFNSGTFGIALLGTLTAQAATPSSRSALERVLAWNAQRNGIDPRGAATYTNPVTLARTRFANIAGHRDVGSTECPGGAFYNTLPMIRSDVAAIIAAPPTPSPSPTPTATPTPTPTPRPTPRPTPTPSPLPTPCEGDCP